MRLSEPYRLEHWQSGIGAACTAERVRLLFVLSRTSLFASLAAVALVTVWLWPVAAPSFFYIIGIYIKFTCRSS